MASIEYSLFRAKFIRSQQVSFLYDDLTPSDIMMKAIAQRPSSELRIGYHWHIGNLSMFSEYSGYFAIGRTTTSTIEKFDEVTGDFVEEELEESPYTHCVFDAKIGFFGIAKKPNLSQTTKGIAGRVAELLSGTKVVVANAITVDIRPIPDPEGFIKALDTAFRVYSFSASFRGPNPFDADEHFQKPLSVYLSAAKGNKGKAQISGDDLNRQVLQQVTRSTAATGNEASARIQRQGSQKSITINLKGDPVKRKYEEDYHRPEIVLADLTNLYNQVRHDE